MHGFKGIILKGYTKIKKPVHPEEGAKHLSRRTVRTGEVKGHYEREIKPVRPESFVKLRMHGFKGIISKDSTNSVGMKGLANIQN